LILFCGLDLIDLAHDRDQWRVLVNAVMHLRVPYHAGKFLSGYTTSELSGSAQLHRVRNSFLVAHGLRYRGLSRRKGIHQKLKHCKREKIA
jgi:hypothetical protein